MHSSSNCLASAALALTVAHGATVGLSVGACNSAPPAAPPRAPSTTPLEAGSAKPGADSQADASSCEPSTCSEDDAGASEPRATLEPFVLPAIPPPHERSAQPGDGQWVGVPEVGESDGQPLALRTTLRPHPFRKDVYAAIIAFDLERTELVWVPGAKEPKLDGGAPTARPGVVPKRDHERLLAAFNGGFLTRHGRFGAMLDGSVLVPPREGACTVAITRDGRVEIAPWEELSGKVEGLSAYRQTPACLVHAGQPHERLAAEPKKWGLSAEGKDEIRRSALGVDASGRVLFFGLGEWVVPKEMAKAMQLAGARTAAELDINWSYTRFNFYGRKSPDAGLEVTGTLIPKLVHGKKSYVADIAERDFFYVRRKR